VCGCTTLGSLNRSEPVMEASVGASASKTAGPRKCKLVLLGDHAVGKSSVIARFMYDTFDDSCKATKGIDFLTKTLYLEDHALRLQIWDTAGQERFRSCIPSYIRDSVLALVVYDVTNRASFFNTQQWLEYVRNERGSEVAIALVGNKADLCESRQVSTEEGETMAQESSVIFVETSARTGTNIKVLFRQLGQALPALQEPTATETDGKVAVGTQPEARINNKSRCHR